MKLPSLLRPLVLGIIVASSLVARPLRCSAEEPLLGVFGENSMQRVLDFEAWLGRPVDMILCTVDFHEWKNYRYVDWLSKTVYGARGARRLVYDTPIIINGASYAEAKVGAYDDHWKCLAESIIANNPGDFEIVIRPSHEMNGDWFAWGVGLSRLALIPDFIASWQRFHGVFRGVPGGERFRFSFSSSEGASDPRPMWPGDQYVDLVGYDLYWKPKVMGGEGWETNDPKEAWEKRTTPHGYNEWHVAGMLAFAKAKGKPFQIDEWGVWGPNAAPFVEAMSAFLRTNGARSHTYWNSNSGYPGELSKRDRDWPATTAAFRANWGKKGAAVKAAPAPAEEAPRVLADKEFYTKGNFIAYAGPWSVDVKGGAPLKHGVDYSDVIAVRHSTFPSNVDFAWHWPLTPPKHTGVYGYNAVSYGNYHGGVPEAAVPPKQVKTIEALSETFRFSMARPIGDFNVLTEFFLAQKPDGEPKVAEIGFFLHAAKSAIPYADAGEQLGHFTDASGRAWKVGQQPAPYGPYYMFISSGDVLEGTVDFKAALDFLKGKGKITGEEWFTGLAFGIEPTAGSGSIRLESLSVNYQ